MPIVFLFIFINLALSASSWKEQQLVNGCSIYSTRGEKIKEFPGLMCLFRSNGDLLSAQVDKLSLLDPKQNVKWSISREFHHQINLSFDGKRILTLSSDYEQRGKVPQFGIDRLLVISLEGKILFERSARDLVAHIGEKGTFTPDELTHFNSIYEIPAIDVVGLPDYLKPGNIIANSYGIGVFILSPDLKNILHHFKFTTSKNHRVHDVQVLPNGNYLLFNNIVSDSTDTNMYSAAQEISPDGKVVNEFVASPRETFFSQHMGGVQKLNDDLWLIAHSVTGSYVYSLKNRKIIQNVYQTHFSSHRFIPSQQVKLWDLSSFLKYWK